MAQRLPAILSSLAAGVLLAFLIQINAVLGTHVGVLESTFIAHLVGAVTAFVIIALWLRGRMFAHFATTPRFLFAGGVLGVAITVIGNVVVPEVGLLTYMSLLIVLDLVLSSAADHVGLFGLSRFALSGRRVAGLALAMAGVILIFRG
jgi:bacterial/archaeal transporter family-2 protein